MGVWSSCRDDFDHLVDSVWTDDVLLASRAVGDSLRTIWLSAVATGVCSVLVSGSWTVCGTVGVSVRVGAIAAVGSVCGTDIVVYEVLYVKGIAVATVGGTDATHLVENVGSVCVTIDWGRSTIEWLFGIVFAVCYPLVCNRTALGSRCGAAATEVVYCLGSSTIVRSVSD